MLRLFVAIYPPVHVVDALGRTMRDMELDGCRAVPSEQVHLTVLFIGAARPSELGRVCESVERSCAGLDAFTLTPLRLITLPRSGRPRLVACETDAPAVLMEIRRRLARRLAANPRRDPVDRFRPHLTLCRARGRGRLVRVERPVDIPSFVVHRVVLVRSELHADGARHTPVHVVPLSES